MNLHELTASSYGARIVGGRLGPRRELILDLELWPTWSGKRMTTWLAGTGPRVRARFGGISNHDEISAFFAPLLADCDHIDGLHYLRLAKDAATPPNRLCLEMEFDRSGTHVEIRCRSVNVVASQDEVGEEPTHEHAAG